MGIFDGKSSIGLCSEQRLEWILTDLSAILSKTTTIPIQETQSNNVIELIVKHSEMKSIVTCSEYIPLFIDISERVDAIKNIICMDRFNLTLVDQERLKKRDVSFHFFTEVEELGKKWEEDYPIIKSEKSDIMTIVYTSGSTGKRF